MMEPEEHLRRLTLKILVLGTINVGKTSFIQRYCNDHFSQQYKTTIGVDYGIKRMCWKNEFDLQLQFCDISGQERFANLTRVFYKGASGVLIVCSHDDKDTLNQAMQWKDDLDDKLPGLPCILVVNKCDLTDQRSITIEDIEHASRVCQFDEHIHTSAKKNINIELSVKHLVNRMMDNAPPTPRSPPETPRSAQHQYYDRPSPRHKHEKNTIRLTHTAQQDQPECCWLL